MESHHVEFIGHDGQTYHYDTRIRDDSVAGHPVKMTSFHSVVDPHWSTSYLLLVQQAEREARHEICGAETQKGSPCKQYPLKLEDEPYPDEIGRCSRHRPSMKKEEPSSPPPTSIALSPSRSPPPAPTDSRLADTLMDIADEHFFLRCQACINRVQCDERGGANDICMKEKRLFQQLLVEMIETYDLEDVADYFTSVSVVDTMIKIIRTSAYEGQYGIIESINSGNAQYNIHLKKLLNSTLKLLGVDRKTRISVRHKSGKVEMFSGSIAKALASAKITDAEVIDATKQMEKDIKMEEPKGTRKGPAVGIHGKIIKDDEPIES
ncbi:MAG: hypothetical protein GF411_02995 [Candidatus Lokiarchaeota archaeon]|nr:hypothetical protein [Candidatus Lokiarchaeota archaeon]